MWNIWGVVKRFVKTSSFNEKPVLADSCSKSSIVKQFKIPRHL